MSILNPGNQLQAPLLSRSHPRFEKEASRRYREQNCQKAATNNVRRKSEDLNLGGCSRDPDRDNTPPRTVFTNRHLAAETHRDPVDEPQTNPGAVDKRRLFPHLDHGLFLIRNSRAIICNQDIDPLAGFSPLRRGDCDSNFGRGLIGVRDRIIDGFPDRCRQAIIRLHQRGLGRRDSQFRLRILVVELVSQIRQQGTYVTGRVVFRLSIEEIPYLSSVFGEFKQLVGAIPYCRRLLLLVLVTKRLCKGLGIAANNVHGVSDIMPENPIQYTETLLTQPPFRDFGFNTDKVCDLTVSICDRRDCLLNLI